MYRGIKNSIYNVIDLLTLHRGIAASVNGESIRFGPRWARYFEKDYEAATFKFLKNHCRLNGTVIDLGAHIGLFSVLAARLVGPAGKVFAFEPTTFTRSVLEQTVKLNGVSDRVEVHSEAMGESAGTAKFFQTDAELSVANSLVQYGSLTTAGTEHHGSASMVNVLGLDDFVTQRGLHVDFLKIDVEGAELPVLRGAPKTFAMRPFVSLGLHPEPIAISGGSLQQIWDLLVKYRMTVSEDEKPVSEQDFCGRTDRFDVQLCPM